MPWFLLNSQRAERTKYWKLESFNPEDCSEFGKLLSKARWLSSLPFKMVASINIVNETYLPRRGIIISTAEHTRMQAFWGLCFQNRAAGHFGGSMWCLLDRGNYCSNWAFIPVLENQIRESGMSTEGPWTRSVRAPVWSRAGILHWPHSCLLPPVFRKRGQVQRTGLLRFGAEQWVWGWGRAWKGGSPFL